MKDEEKKNNEIDNDVEKIEIDEDLEIVKDVKSNESIMKEKVDEILKDFDKNDVIYKRKRRNKTIFYIIGIIIEIIIIVLIVKNRYVNKETSNEYTSVKCSNTTENIAINASITMNNTYYFNKDNKVNKTENEIVYIFNDKESYERYKSDYVSTDINNFTGLNQQTIFDDNNYVFKSQTIYDYSELKKNKNVSINGDILTLNIPDRTDPVVISIEDYDTVLDTNQNMNFICE